MAGPERSEQASPLAASRRSDRAFVAAICAVALTLRVPTSSLAAVLEPVTIRLGLTHTLAGLLTSIPVLCMAAAPPFVALLMGRDRIEAWVLGAMVIATASLCLRALPDVQVLFISTLISGLTVAALQVALPALIKGRARDAVTMTSVYATLSTAGSDIALGCAGPMFSALGSWNLALAAWSAPVGVAALLWAMAVRAQPARSERNGRISPSVWRESMTWRMGLFSAASSLLFWSVTSWFPSIYILAGSSALQAGRYASILSGSQIVASFIVTALVARQSKMIVVRLTTLAAGTAGLLLLAWKPLDGVVPIVLLLGFGIGGLFPLAMAMPVELATQPQQVRALAAMSLTVGYTIASIGPFALGALRDATGTFEVPLLALALSVCLLGLVGAAPQRGDGHRSGGAEKSA